MSTSKYTNQNRDISGIENITNFEVFNPNRYLDPFVGGYSFIFVTKPSLFIYPISDGNDYLQKIAFENMKRDPLFSQYIIGENMNESDLLLLEQLSYYDTFPSPYIQSNFMPIFTNKCKGIDMTDITMDQAENFETKEGFKMPLPTNKTLSQASNTISIGVTETANLDFIKMMSIWVNYISNITDGTFAANPEMIKAGIIDYMSSVYYFTMQPDGRTIKYWCKYTGCWPTAIPYSQMRYTKGDNSIAEHDLQFVYTTKEDMNPVILEEFNRVSLNINYTAGVYDSDLEYYTIKENQFLNSKELEKLLQKGYKCPLVFCNDLEGNKRFQLTFNTEQTTPLSSIFDNNNYFYDQSDFFSQEIGG